MQLTFVKPNISPRLRKCLRIHHLLHPRNDFDNVIATFRSYRAGGSVGSWAGGSVGRMGWRADGLVGRWAGGPVGWWACGLAGRRATGPVDRLAGGLVGQWVLRAGGSVGK